MRTIVVVCCAALCALPTQFVLAQRALLLVDREGEQTLVSAEDGQTRVLRPVGDKLIYGESAGTLAIVSQRRSTGAFQLDIVDAVTGKQMRSWPVKGYAAGSLSGATKDVVLTATHAYYATVRYAKDGQSIEPNGKGGSFDLNAMSLADGSVQAVPLPKDCRAPRLVDFHGTPLVYTWNGAGVWKLDPRTLQLQDVVARDEIEDSIALDRNSTVAPIRTDTFADYLVVPDQGIFRLSRFGTLRQITNGKLALSSGQQRMLTGDTQDSVLGMIASKKLGKPVIGVLRKAPDGRVSLAYLDPTSMQPLSEISLGSGLVQGSVFPLDDGGILFVDRESSAVVKASEAGMKVLWALDRAGLEETRILAVRGPIS